MSQNPFESLLNAVRGLTNGNPAKWKQTGNTCFLFSPNDPAIFMCRYYNENDQLCISVSTIDLKGVTTSETIINEISDKDTFDKFDSLYNQVKEIAYSNTARQSNEAIFKNMVINYGPPDIFSKLK